MMISYGQNGEDVVLARTFWDHPGGFYIDVGAWDPEVHSVTKLFYDIGWQGINIEPQPDRLAALSAARPRDINLGVAVSDADGAADLFVTRDSGLATLEPAVIDPTQDGYAVETTLRVPAHRLSDLIDAHCPQTPIAFLKIDVEGHEAAVLRGLDLRRHRPIVLVVEATRPTQMTPSWAEWEWMILSCGYDVQLFDGLNRFYLRADRSDLAPRLSLPVNIFDQYVTVREKALHDRIRALEAQLAALTQPA